VKQLKGKVAVVTGGASGIGRAIAIRLAAEKMKIVLADIEAGQLGETERELRELGAEVLAVVTDVSNAQSVEDLARRSMETFGAIHVVCNNAGVGGAVAPMWEPDLDQWKWTIGVNLWGVIHGIHTFLPILLRQNEGHVVNTASMLGLVSEPFTGIYNATKHAVVTISETLSGELAVMGSNVRVSVLCPNFVASRIHDYERNRPHGLTESLGKEHAMLPSKEDIRRTIEAGMPASEAAEYVVQAIRNEQLYILTHPGYSEIKRLIRRLWSLSKGVYSARVFRAQLRKRTANI
jgi:NAD(P)-dependent dehydrogenase (short-subunit alcohol dehydrogenase family)